MSNIKNEKFHGSPYGEIPGQPPFTHGIYSDMYTKKLWTMRQYAGFSSAEESNKRYKYLLKKGVTGLSIAFDLPTQTGYDSDHMLSKGEVGKVGVPICSMDDTRILLKDIPLEKWKTFHKFFEKDIYEKLLPSSVVESRLSSGGTGFERVQEQLVLWREKLFK